MRDETEMPATATLLCGQTVLQGSTRIDTMYIHVNGDAQLQFPVVRTSGSLARGVSKLFSCFLCCICGGRSCLGLVPTQLLFLSAVEIGASLQDLKVVSGYTTGDNPAVMYHVRIS